MCVYTFYFRWTIKRRRESIQLRGVRDLFLVQFLRGSLLPQNMYSTATYSHYISLQGPRKTPQSLHVKCYTQVEETVHWFYLLCCRTGQLKFVFYSCILYTCRKIVITNWLSKIRWLYMIEYEQQCKVGHYLTWKRYPLALFVHMLYINIPFLIRGL